MTNTDREHSEHDEAALKRIQKEEYGVCANCQEEMQQKRLKLCPGPSTASHARRRLKRAQL